MNNKFPDSTGSEKLGFKQSADRIYSKDGNTIEKKLTEIKDEMSNNMKEIHDEIENTVNDKLTVKDEVIETQITSWLDSHPEATTTVQDKTITMDKLSDDISTKISNALLMEGVQIRVNENGSVSLIVDDEL